MVMNVPVQVAPRSELPVPQLRMPPAGKGLVLRSDVGGDLEGLCTSARENSSIFQTSMHVKREYVTCSLEGGKKPMHTRRQTDPDKNNILMHTPSKLTSDAPAQDEPISKTGWERRKKEKSKT